MKMGTILAEKRLKQPMQQNTRNTPFKGLVHPFRAQITSIHQIANFPDKSRM